jgi:hypothetical protein
MTVWNTGRAETISSHYPIIVVEALVTRTIILWVGNMLFGLVDAFI